MSKVKAKILRKGHLDGTIDGHDPVFVTYRMSGGDRDFLFTVYSVNLGRGYTPEKFLANVKRLFDHAERGTRYIAILLQEIDETDPSPEHKIIRKMVVDLFGDRAHFIQWHLREPIILIGADIEVTHEGKRMTMDQGTLLNPPAPSGTGPRRFLTHVRFKVHGLRISVANQHPHRYSLRSRGVVLARRAGEKITRQVLSALVRVSDFVVDGGDLNTKKYPRWRPSNGAKKPRQRVYRRGLDYVRDIVT